MSHLTKKIKKIFNFAGSKLFYLMIGLWLSLAVSMVNSAVVGHDVDSGDRLTASKWNTMLENVADKNSLDSSDGLIENALFIDAAGDVGIGTSLPDQSLEISRSGDD